MKSLSTIPDSNITKLFDFTFEVERELKKMYLEIGKSIVGKNLKIQAK